MGRGLSPAAIRREEDPEWRGWFQDVHNRKKDGLKAGLGIRISLSEGDDGGGKRIVRPAADPLPLGKALRTGQKKSGLALLLDKETLTRVWTEAAGRELAEQSDVRGFKNGVLTIGVASAPWLQEIRQFRQKELLAALRKIWPGETPLIRVNYRAGGKK